MNDPSGTYQELTEEVSVLIKKLRDLETAKAACIEVIGTLRQSEEQYRTLLSESPDPTFSLTADGQYKYANKAFAAGVGKPIEDIIGKTMWDVFTREEADKRFAALSHVFRTGVEKVIEVRVPREDTDRYYITTITPVIGANGKIHSVVCTSKDITERKRVEEALLESEEQLRILSENIADGMVYQINSGADGQQRVFTYLSPAIHDLHGLTVEDVKQNPSLLYDQIDEQYRSVITAAEVHAYQTRSKLDIDLPVRLPGGDVRWRRFISSPRTTPDGNVIWDGIELDITERKQSEEERNHLQRRLQQAEKMEALGTLAGGVAHDLNNVLGILVGYSDLLLNDIPADSVLRNHVEKIMMGGVRAAAIVNDLLTLARRGIQSESVLNLNSIITDFLKTLEFENLQAAHPGLRIKTDLAYDLLNIRGSSPHIYKTFMNLLNNAVEAMPGGGLLTVTTRNRNLDRPLHGYDEVREGDYVLLSVSDTGMGISGDDIKHIFEPFFTKKVMGRSGTGLGLAVVWGTVKDHGGYIDVQSEPGCGSTLALYFPVTREAMPVSASSISLSDYIGKDEAILVVDDIAEQRELAAGMLGRLNYKVSTVAGGEQAVEYLKSHRVDLIVLDMIMDPGIDGLETYRRIIEIRPKQKAIIVSGFSESSRVRAAQSLGAGAYLKKPYIIEKLGMAVRNELDRTA
jgi:PAS domain S-box-containing protein